MKPIPDDIIALFFYTEESPSCLAWAVDVYAKKSIFVKKGTSIAHLNSDGYYCVNVKGVNYRVHRIIAKMHGLEIDNKQIDHIDGDRKNNKICNLRAVEVKSNARNQKLRANSFSGVTGVNYEKSENKWCARYVDEHGIKRNKSFSISRHGENAFNLAVDYRISMIKKLNELGAGYTDRHIGTAEAEKAKGGV